MFTLAQVAPWGRSFDEYRRMFALSEADLQGRLLGCADGPAAFNAQATRQGARVVSCDPLYRFGAAEIRARIAQATPLVLEQTRAHAGDFLWDAIPSIEALAELRRRAMELFLDDFEPGKSAGRYLDAELPQLPFANNAFDLAVCSHFLFLYSEHLGEAFHVQAAREMMRVAGEARVFPLLALGGRPSPLVEAVTTSLRQQGHAVSLEPVPYEFQRGGNQMLRVRRRG